MCPEGWRESFEAGEELARRYEAIPDEVIARGYLELEEIPEEDEEEVARWKERYERSYGLTEELMATAIGPDEAREEISEDEGLRRLEEHMADILWGEKGYRVLRHMQRLRESMNKEMTSERNKP